MAVIGWTPAYRLLQDAGPIESGVDITELIAHRLVRLVCDREAQDRSDRLTLDIDDREIDGRVFELPPDDQGIWLTLGYKETHEWTQGLFRVDEMHYEGPPKRVMVKASAAGFSQSIRMRKEERTFHRTTLGAAAEAIAQDHGLEAKVDPAVANKAITHADQTKESDIAFITRLAKQHDAVAKPVGNRFLVVVPKSQKRKTSGPNPPATAGTFEITLSEVMRWRYQDILRRPSGQSGDDKGGVKAFWRDYKANERKSVTVGNPPFEEIEHEYPNREDALAAAQSRFSEDERQKNTLSVTMPGRPDLMTEAELVLKGWRPRIPTSWRITRIRHTVDNEFTTQIDAELLN